MRRVYDSHELQLQTLAELEIATETETGIGIVKAWTYRSQGQEREVPVLLDHGYLYRNLLPAENSGQ